MAEIQLYGTIGDPDAQLDAATVCPVIRNSTGDLTVRINSPGGYVFEGLPIYAAIKAYNAGTVTVIIDGLAASMASVIAMAGQVIIMAESALMMIHKPWDCSIGNADELRSDAARLDKMEASLVDIYAGRTGLDPDEISVMLAAETWLDATEAVAFGFADRVNATLPMAAMADLTACGFRRGPSLNLKGRTTMPQANPGAQAALAERERVTQIQSLCERHRLGGALAMTLVNRGSPLADARETILEALAQRDMATSGIGLGGAVVTFDDPNFLGKALADAMYAKMSGKPAEGAAAHFRGMSIVDMAAELVDRTGRGNSRRMTPDQILNAAAWVGSGPRGATSPGQWGGGGTYGSADITGTTGDFPDLLQGTGQRYLLDMYRNAESPLKSIARPRAAKDFRQIKTLQLSEFGTLPVVSESGEVTTGKFAERQEVYSMQTFAKQFTLTRQALINDDLGAFTDVLTIMGRAAAETEAQLLAALINANPVMSDGNSLFSSSHGNLNATGSAPSVAALDVARQAMRNQTDLDGTTYINAAPKFILSPPGYETVIEKLISIPLNPNQVDYANPFAGKLTPLVDPRLSAGFWYLFADPSFVPTMEYASRNNSDGPIMEMQNGWDVLGVAFRVHEDFGAGIVDWRGAYRQAGA